MMLVTTASQALANAVLGPNVGVARGVLVTLGAVSFASVAVSAVVNVVQVILARSPPIQVLQPIVVSHIIPMKPEQSIRTGADKGF